VNSRRSLSMVTHADITQKFKMTAVKLEIHVSPFEHGISMLHDSNEIPTDKPMFFGLGNTERLVGILSDVWVCRKSKMAAINRK